MQGAPKLIVCCWFPDHAIWATANSSGKIERHGSYGMTFVGPQCNCSKAAMNHARSILHISLLCLRKLAAHVQKPTGTRVLGIPMSPGLGARELWQPKQWPTGKGAGAGIPRSQHPHLEVQVPIPGFSNSICKAIKTKLTLLRGLISGL